MKSFSRALLVSILVPLLVCACGGREDQSGRASRVAPDFALKDLKGGICRLADLKGKVLILNFFATWCGPCRQEIPDLIRIYERFQDKGLEIIGVSLDQGGEAVLKPFIKRYGITYPIVMGNREVVLDFGGVQGIPTTFFIDHKGEISNSFIGLRPAYMIEESVKKLLEQRG
jgi:peroxiredoxin